MNPLLILLGIVFVVAMVVFGNNPMDKARKEHDKNTSHTGDPAYDAWQEWQSKSNHNGGNMTNGNSIYGNTFNQPGQPGQAMGQGNTGMGGGYAPNNNNRLAPAQTNVPNVDNPSEDNYYPPAPAAPGHSSLIPRSPKIPSYAPVYSLASGQLVRFAGVHVYTVNAEGKTIPMPDGRYRMYNGRIDLVVKGGEKRLTRF